MTPIEKPAMTMSTTPGYPDLTKGQRRALCRTLDEIEATKRILRYDGKLKRRLSKSARQRRDSLLEQADRLRESVENQFPEFRAERCVDRKGARTNSELRQALRALQSDVALLFDWTDRDVRDHAAAIASGREPVS